VPLIFHSGKLYGKPLLKPRGRWDNNIKIVLKQRGYEVMKLHSTVK
jgi:hypothetical protein